jgi:hypothetical protein
MSRKLFLVAFVIFVAALVSRSAPSAQRQASFDDQIRTHAQQMIDEGKKTFRFDTFGDEAFWGDQLQLHKAVAGAKLGGVGPGHQSGQS